MTFEGLEDLQARGQQRSTREAALKHTLVHDVQRSTREAALNTRAAALNTRAAALSTRAAALNTGAAALNTRGRAPGHAFCAQRSMTCLSNGVASMLMIMCVKWLICMHVYDVYDIL
eukprot:TRINITY_DN3099_c0_g2_i1.p2 TRINITY_DN3099_c0_g2~~TRINITY_DN3099_c0_g2_i1.p2  ORF type:complete len:117 (+),score=30.03 TRINITY_DN3099_c0_g2_i1:401-751(+)